MKIKSDLDTHKFQWRLKKCRWGMKLQLKIWSWPLTPSRGTEWASKVIWRHTSTKRDTSLRTITSERSSTCLLVSHDATLFLESPRGYLISLFLIDLSGKSRTNNPCRNLLFDFMWTHLLQLCYFFSRIPFYLQIQISHKLTSHPNIYLKLKIKV